MSEMPVLEKSPWEDDLFDFVFHSDSFREDEVIASVDSITYTAYGSGTLSITGLTHDDEHTVQANISGGDAGSTYKIVVKVLTDLDDHKKQFCALLRILDC